MAHMQVVGGYLMVFFVGRFLSFFSHRLMNKAAAMGIPSSSEVVTTSTLPLLQQEDTVPGVVDYKGRSVRRSSSGGWRSAGFIIGKCSDLTCFLLRSFIVEHHKYMAMVYHITCVCRGGGG